jgi:hypothetical protein
MEGRINLHKKENIHCQTNAHTGINKIIIDGIQSEEAGDQSAEHKRLLLNNPQAMDDRLINLERKFYIKRKISIVKQMHTRASIRS